MMFQSTFRSTCRINNQCTFCKCNVAKRRIISFHFFCLAITKGGLLHNVSILLLDIFEKWKCDVRSINSWWGWRNLIELDILIKTVRLSFSSRRRSACSKTSTTCQRSDGDARFFVISLLNEVLGMTLSQNDQVQRPPLFESSSTIYSLLLHS